MQETIPAGSLDRRITIQRVTTAPNEFNEPIETWRDLVTVFASKQDISDAERWSAGAIGAEITTRFQIRYSSQLAALDNRDRVIFDGRVFDIAGVKEIGRRKGLEITAAAKSERV
jgi:SPP1 family predicted phage head-tail adaptor